MNASLLRRRLVASVVLFVAGTVVQAADAARPTGSVATSGTVALVHARLYTMESAQPIEDATVVIRGGTVQAIGAALAPPAGARVIDLQGHIVTPSLMSAGSQLGLLEVASVPDTHDSALATGPLGAAFDVQYALNTNATALGLALDDGLTRTITFPEGAPIAPFMGQGAMLHLGTEALLERAKVAMFVRVGAAGAATAGGSRSASWQLLRSALDEARRYKPSAGPRDQLLNHLDAEALQPVVAGRMPLAIVADRESDLRQVIRLRDEMSVPIIVYGGAEAWRVAPELAQRQIPVVLDPTLNIPLSFDALGARLDNAARLQAAGVRIAFSVSAFHRTFNAGSETRLGAGLAVANGLPWIEAMRAMTTAPAAIYGLSSRYGVVKPGVDADLVAWDGDPLEPMTSALHVWVRGVEVNLGQARERELARRYAPTQRADVPPAYRH